MVRASSRQGMTIDTSSRVPGFVPAGDWLSFDGSSVLSVTYVTLSQRPIYTDTPLSTETLQPSCQTGEATFASFNILSLCDLQAAGVAAGAFSFTTFDQAVIICIHARRKNLAC